MYIITTLVYMHISMKKYKFCEKSIDQIKNAPPESFSAHTDKLHTYYEIVNMHMQMSICYHSVWDPVAKKEDKMLKHT